MKTGSKYILVIATVIAIYAPSCFGGVSLTGAGLDSCAAFNDKNRKDSEGERREILAWASGYVSGRNTVDRAVMNSFARIPQTFETDLWSYLTEKCAKDKSLGLWALIMKFVTELPRETVEGG